MDTIPALLSCAVASNHRKCVSGKPLIYQSSSWICQRSLDEECERCSSQSSHLAKTISHLSPTLPEGKTVTKTGLAGPWGQAFTTLLLAVGSPRLWPETADVWGCHRQYGHPWVFMHEDYVKVFIKKIIYI